MYFMSKGGKGYYRISLIKNKIHIQLLFLLVLMKLGNRDDYNLVNTTKRH